MKVHREYGGKYDYSAVQDSQSFQWNQEISICGRGVGLIKFSRLVSETNQNYAGHRCKANIKTVKIC